MAIVIVETAICWIMGGHHSNILNLSNILIVAITAERRVNTLSTGEQYYA